MSKQFRQIAMATVFLGFFTQVAHSAEGITTPAANDTWDEEDKDKSVVFDWENGCSGYSVFINRKDNNAQLFYASHGTANANPESYHFGTVPHPGGASGTSVAVTVKTVYTHTNGTASTITKDFYIKNK